jgi:hypothetical protein
VSPVTIILVAVLFAMVAAGLIVAALDLTKLSVRALDRRRALRICRRGWDWQAFEREVATYARTVQRRRRAAPPH